MLSRLADFLYWLGRNVERAETLARSLEVTYVRSVDLYGQRDGRGEAMWSSVMEAIGFAPGSSLPAGGKAAAAAIRHIAFDPSNPSSIVSGIRIARSNALGIRSELTSEVWESINVLYLYVEDQDPGTVLRAPSAFLHHVRDVAQGFAGISDATLNHGQGWNFLQAGRYLERAYLTSRILASVDVAGEPWPESQRLLEMCCASVPFAQQSHTSPEPRDVVEFMLLAGECPRSMRFATHALDGALHRISGTPEHSWRTAPERRSGRMRARFDFTGIDEIVVGDLRRLALELASEYEALSGEIEAAYFPRLPVTS